MSSGQGYGALIAAGVGGLVSAGLLYYAHRQSGLHRALEGTETRSLDKAAAALQPGESGRLAAVRGTVEALGNDALQLRGKDVVHVENNEVLLCHAVVQGVIRERRYWVRRWIESRPYAVRDGSLRAEVAGFSSPPLIPAPTQMLRVSDAAFDFHARMAAGERDPTGLVDLSVYNAPLGQVAVGIERSSDVLAVGTLLTVVGRLSKRSDGSLVIEGGAGPFLITMDTLEVALEKLSNRAWWSKWGGVIIGAAAGVLLGHWAYHEIRRRRERQHEQPDPWA